MTVDRPTPGLFLPAPLADAAADAQAALRCVQALRAALTPPGAGAQTPLPAAASNAAEALVLVNAIRAALLTLGLCQTQTDGKKK